MINSKRVFMDPLVQGNMARLEGTAGTAVPPGLPKADNVPQYSQDKSLNYRRSYMSCSLSGQETLEPPSAWSPSRTFVRNGASPVVHSSATEGTITNPTFYRPEKVSFPVDSNSPVAVQELALKQKLAYYIRSKQSPNTAGVVSPVAFRKLPIACPSLSPSRAENSGGLAIPKPVYGYSPCCTDRKCPVNHNYAMGRELQMAPPQMFEDEWSSHYRHWAYLHKKKQEALMQQRILPFEHCGERVPLKDVTTQGYHGLSPSRPRRMSAFSEPSHSSYPYSPARPFVPPSPEHCQRLQMHPQMHKDLPPMYEAVTRMRYGSPTQVYPDHHHVYKYREIPQHSLLYCSQDNTEVYRAQNPHHMVEKEASGQCPVPPPYYTDLPDSYPMIPTGLPAVSNLPAYPTYRMNLNSGQVNPFTERPRPPPIMHQVDRPLDFSMRKEQNADTQQEPHRELGISGTFHPTQVPNHVDSQNCTLGTANQSRDGFPVSGSHNYTVSPQYTGSISNKKQDLCMPESQANVRLILKRRRDEKDNACEDESLEKVQKLDQQLSDERQLPSCPPMPVINKVFSLAPYKAYLEAAGMFSHENSSKSTPPKDSKPTKEEPEKQCTDPETTIGQEGLKLKETPQDGNHNTDELQLVEVKKEKVEPDESSCQSEMYDNPDPAISHDCINESVKEEPADLKPVVCETDHSLVVVKSDTEPECKTEAPEMPEPSLEFNTEPSPMDRVETVQTPSSGPNASDLTVTLPAEPQTSPQTMFSVSKIPAHCLKLTSYNIIVPKVLKPPVPPSPETVQSAADSRLAMSSSRQARYLFMELHQSLCRLISACVSQTPQLELRKWLSSLDLVSPPTKTQKVSCLLGSKAREFWLKGQETAVALQKVVGQFENYVRTQECPFPHVIRAGAVFIPMLVVKEVLFPQVQGTFIDQVLQEHRVELRPTTLSEERHLTQLHKRAFSSKLRRLLSLKHLPDIYPDVLNLLYYESVCKFLDSTPTDDVQNIAKE
ncbi:uncharacterized protein C15orf39 homolog [Hoplias malabaricus]|uniref:uncharacterized protein C15orf39 homolog n=1 Tax=Hoplias malabaricus TaxID=27720 RepID=UPI003462CFED